MKRWSAVFASGVLAAALAQAQQPAPRQPEAGAEGQQPAEITEGELETFADIYVDLEATVRDFEEEISSVASEEQAQEVQARMQREAFEKISRHGWTPEKYNMVIEAVNADPALLDKALGLIEDR